VKEIGRQDPLVEMNSYLEEKEIRDHGTKIPRSRSTPSFSSKEKEKKKAKDKKKKDKKKDKKHKKKKDKKKKKEDKYAALREERLQRERKERIKVDRELYGQRRRSTFSSYFEKQGRR